MLFDFDGVVVQSEQLHMKTFLELLEPYSVKVIEAALKIFGLNKFFDIVVSGDKLEKRKPDPEPFLYAARKLKITPTECIAIEDSVSGAKSVKAAGIKLVIIRSPVEIKDKSAIEIIDFKGFELSY